MFVSLLASFSKIIAPYFGLILIILVGIAAGWWGIFTQERIDILTEIVMVLILPIFIFWNAATSSVSSVISQAPWMVGLGFCVGLVGYGLATFIAWFNHWEWSRRTVLQVSGSSGNTGFLGIPICTAIYGSQGTILAILFDLGATFYILTIGIGAFQNESQTKYSSREQLKLLLKQFASPIFIALILGLGFSLSGWQVPVILRFPLENLSNIAIPMMMLILGGVIYDTAKNHRMDKGSIALLGALKLMILPVLTILAVSFLPLAQTSKGVVVVEAAMPSAIMAVTLAARYNADENLASMATVLTTIISLFTIPIFASIYR